MSSPFLQVPQELLDVNLVAIHWAECLWAGGDEHSFLATTLSALRHSVLALKRHLPCYWRMHSAWSRDEPPQRAVSLARLQMQTMTGWFVM